MVSYKKLLAAGLFLLSAHTLATEQLIVGTEGAYPPFSMVDASGQVVGFDIDIANALCAQMKAECNFVVSDWDGLIPALNAKKFDFLIAFMTITEERKQAVSFTDPYFTNELQFVASKNADFKTDKASLKGKVIGVLRASVSADWLEENLGDSVSIKLYDTQENAYLDLSSGRVDAVLTDKPVNEEWLGSEMGKEFEFKDKPVFDDDKIGIATRKNDPLVDSLNQALKTIYADGTYQKIYQKYFPAH